MIKRIHGSRRGAPEPQLGNAPWAVLGNADKLSLPAFTEVTRAKARRDGTTLLLLRGLAALADDAAEHQVYGYSDEEMAGLIALGRELALAANPPAEPAAEPKAPPARRKA